MNARPGWARRFPNSGNNFDLVLLNPQEVDVERLNELLSLVEGETHRRLTLSSRACKELRRFFHQPDTPLKSEAYVLLSNWFMTQSGDRNSLVASRCEDLWDALFPCRPLERLSSPEAGRNHVAEPAAFDSFWRRLSEAQGDDAQEVSGAGPESNTKLSPRKGALTGVHGDSNPERVRALLDKQGLHIEIEGSPRAIADFLQMVSRWEGA